MAEVKEIQDKEKKPFLNISPKDMQLLVIVLAVGLLACAYFFGYSSLSEKETSLEAQYATLQKTEKDLQEKNNNKAKYESDTAVFKSKYEKMLTEYANGNDQAAVVDFVNKLEVATDVWIKSVGFSQPMAIHTFGRVTPSNPSATGNAYSTDMVGNKLTLTVSYETNYEGYKKVIDFINTYPSKNTIDNIASSYTSESDTVTGSITYSMYYITSKDRKFEEPTFDVPIGSANIFTK